MQNRFDRWARRSRIWLLIIGLYVFVVRDYSLNPEKLFPKIKDGDIVLALKMSFLTRDPKRGEIILYDVQVPGKYYFSRVVGLPGESIDISSGVVRINGRNLAEPYALSEQTYSYSGLIPADAYFVLPDDRRNLTLLNRRNSGPIRKRDMQGRLWLGLWPFTMRL